MTISELRKRSNKFVQNLDSIISDVVDHNEELLQLNKSQLKQSKTSKGTSLINSRTGSDKYSPAYAKRKGYSKPDLFDTGEFYREMDIQYNEPNDYLITSFVDYTKHLVDSYSEFIFGIFNKTKAKAITTKAIANIYRRRVL